MNRKYGNQIALVVFFSTVVLFLHKLGITHYLSLGYLQHKSVALRAAVEHNYAWSVFLYVVLYTILVATGIPVLIPFTLLGGYLFGTVASTGWSLIGATVGSVIYFLLVRHSVGVHVQKKYSKQLAYVNKRIQEFGVSYLLVLHYSAVFPFFMINTVAALTNISLFTFIWTTIGGSLPLLFIYSFAGKELATISRASDIFSLHIILALGLLMALAIVPMMIKRWRGNSGV